MVHIGSCNRSAKPTLPYIPVVMANLKQSQAYLKAFFPISKWSVLMLSHTAALYSRLDRTHCFHVALFIYF